MANCNNNKDEDSSLNVNNVNTFFFSLMFKSKLPCCSKRSL